MTYISEEEKFNAGKVVRIEMKAFMKSPSSRLVGDGEDVKTVLRLFLECFYIYHDMAPREMDGAAFREVVLKTLPRRFTGKETFVGLVPSVVRAYMDYLKRLTHIPDLAVIEKTIAELDEGFIKAVEEIEEADRIPDVPPATQIVRDFSKVGRNDPCPCGSGKKYKKCCLGKEKEKKV